MPVTLVAWSFWHAGFGPSTIHARVNPKKDAHYKNNDGKCPKNLFHLCMPRKCIDSWNVAQFGCSRKSPALQSRGFLAPATS